MNSTTILALTNFFKSISTRLLLLPKSLSEFKLSKNSFQKEKKIINKWNASRKFNSPAAFRVCLFSRGYVRDKTFLGLLRWPRILRIFTRHVCIHRYTHTHIRSLNESEYRSGIAALETRVTKSEIQYRGCVFPLFSIHLPSSLLFLFSPSLSLQFRLFYFFFSFSLYIRIYINSTNKRV